MGNKVKSKNKKDGEIRIITDKQKKTEYTFIDDGLTNQLASNHSNNNGESEELKKEEKNNNMSHSLSNQRIIWNTCVLNPIRLQKHNLSKTILLFMNNTGRLISKNPMFPPNTPEVDEA